MPRRHRSSGQEVAELLERVRQKVRDSPLTQRQIEQRVGFSAGYLSQVLHGHVDLKFRHLLAILAALGSEPGPFFASLFEHRQPTSRTVASRSRRAIERSALGSDPLSLQLARLYGYGIESLADLEHRLELVERALDELRRQDLID